MKRRASFTLILITALARAALFSQESGEEWKDTVYALQQSFREISAGVLPVVVEITVVERRKEELPSFNPWQFFFSEPEASPQLKPREREFTRTGLGSGVIVDQRGNRVYVITNHHVAGEADEIRVTLYDGRQFEAVLAGTDPPGDLALLSFVSDEILPLAVLGDSDDLRTGDWVLAVGNPYGYESTVTQGIISATGRSDREGRSHDYLQTDASINSGNSGGALVNMKGEVVGINSWIATRNGGSIGLGFAIPSNRVKANLEDLIGQGKVEYGWLGVNMGTATESLKTRMGLHEWQGAFVFNVYAGSPAWDDGLRPGDLIIALDGVPVNDGQDLTEQIILKKPGADIKITFVRGDREYTRSIRLADKGGLTRARQDNRLWPGFTVAELNEELRKQLGLSRNSQADMIIGNVMENSPAREAGLQNGDIIKSINQNPVRTMREFYGLLGENRDLSVQVERRGYEFSYRLILP